jgi:hypothetical protein
MSQPADKLSGLFRSLRPDDANFQASLNVAAHQAEERWPLLKAISPQKPALTPALSTEERQRWSNQEQPGTRERKPALSLPGLGDKLTQSLSKMGGRPKVAAAPLSAEPVEPPPLWRAPARRMEAPPPEVPRELASTLFSRSSAIESSVTQEPAGLGLFGKKSDIPAASECLMTRLAAVDDSLASIFSRLAQPEEVVSKALVKRPSFLSRLGKK